MTGIALGVAALIIVLSVMNGFQKDVRDRMLSVLPNIQLYIAGASPEESLPHWQQYADMAKKNPEVRGVAPFVSAQAMVVRGQTLRGVQVQGIDPALEGNVSQIPRQMVAGKLDDLKPGSFGVVLGGDLAAALGVKLGDTVLMLAPQGSVSPASPLQSIRSEKPARGSTATRTRSSMRPWRWRRRRLRASIRSPASRARNSASATLAAR